MSEYETSARLPRASSPGKSAPGNFTKHTSLAEKPVASPSSSITGYSVPYKLNKTRAPREYTTFPEGEHDHHDRPTSRQRKKAAKNILLIVHTEEKEPIVTLVKSNYHVKLHVHFDGKGLEDLVQNLVSNMANDVWICVGIRSCHKAEWLAYIKDLDNIRQQIITKLRLSQSFGIRILAESKAVVTSLPPDMKTIRLFSREMIKSAEDLVRRYDTRLASIRDSIVESEPLLELSVELQANVLDNINSYTRKMYAACIENFQDPSSYIRQHLQHRFFIASVRLFTLENEDGSYERVVLELRPSDLAAFREFLAACEDTSMQTMIQENTNVYEQPMAGTVVLHYKSSDVSRVISVLESEYSKVMMSQSYQPVSLKSTILTERYMACLKDEACSPYEFFSALKKIGCDNRRGTVCEIESQLTGHNALHLAVLHKRPDFLWYIYYSGLWGILRTGLIKRLDPERQRQSLPAQVGYTPGRLAEALSFKAKGYDVMCVFHIIDRLWKTLPDLALACLQDRIDVVKMMVESDLGLLKETDIEGNDCLFYACASGQVALVSYLIQKGADVKNANERMNTCLHSAAMMGHVQVLELLSKNKYLLSLQGPRNSEGCTVLDYCVINNDFDSVRLLYTSTQSKDSKGTRLDPRCLIVAVTQQKHEMMRFLITQCHVDVNKGIDQDGRLPIHHAVIKNDRRAFQILVESGAKITSVLDKFHKNVLHLAAENGISTDFLETIVSCTRDGDNNSDAVLNAHDYWSGREQQFVVRGKDRGRRAWHWVQLNSLSQHAFQSDLATGQIDVARHGAILMSGFGASPGKLATDEVNKLQKENLDRKLPNRTPLHFAVDGGHEELIHIFLAHGADVNEQTYDGITPLHLAAMRGNLRIVQLLEGAHASMEATTRDGQSAQDIALSNGHLDIVNYIKGVVDMVKAQRFIESKLAEKQRKLTEERLNQQRSSGTDIRSYVVSALRDLTIDINEFLFELGSAPIVNQSSHSVSATD